MAAFAGPRRIRRLLAATRRCVLAAAATRPRAVRSAAAPRRAVAFSPEISPRRAVALSPRRRRDPPSRPLRGGATTRVLQVLGTLDRLGAKGDTFVVATSDNGQLRAYSDHFRTGSSGPYRGGKFEGFEGGHRVFGLMRWPGRIVPGVSPRLTSHLDLFPTFAALAGTTPPPKQLDGEDMAPWLFTFHNSTPPLARYARRTHDRVLHIFNCKYAWFMATRIGKYKIWHKNDVGLPVGFVHDLDADPGETRPAAISPGAKKFLVSQVRVQRPRRRRDSFFRDGMRDLSRSSYSAGHVGICRKTEVRPRGPRARAKAASRRCDHLLQPVDVRLPLPVR